MTDFERALKFTLGWEGGYVNDPDDPGGATNQGVTQATYDAWRTRNALGTRPVKELEAEERDAIYRSGYWTPAGCEALRWPLSLVHFDTAVNMGVSRANKLLEAHKDAAGYLHARRNYYIVLAQVKPKMAKFLNGWLNRVKALGKEAHV